MHCRSGVIDAKLIKSIRIIALPAITKPWILPSVPHHCSKRVLKEVAGGEIRGVPGLWLDEMPLRNHT